MALHPIVAEVFADLRDPKEALRRLEALIELSISLSSTASLAEVADVVVEQGMQAAGADTCTLYWLNSAQAALELIGERGTSPDVVERIRRITETEGHPATFAAMQAGSAIWAEDEEQYLAIFPELARLKASGPRAKAFWCVPLRVEGRGVGLLGMGFYAPRSFSANERLFVEAFAHQCGQALVRAERLQSEDAARRWLGTTLRSIGDAVIATDTRGHVTFMNPVAERLTEWAESEARGRPLAEVFSIFSEDPQVSVESPVEKVLREGAVVGLANHTVLRSRHGVETPIADSAAPIVDGRGSVSGVVLVFRDARAEKRELARLDFLSKAGEALASSLDYRTTLAAVARLAVPELGDWCSVDILEPGASTIAQLAVAHVDPSKVEFARLLGQRYPPNPDAKTGVPEVVRTGQAELYTEIPPELLEAGAQDEEHLRIIRQLRLESAMVVPLRNRERVFGAMTFVYAESGRRYDENDLRFANDFARRAAMAIENALALREAQEARAREQTLRGEAEVANRAKDEFLATVSHELRTPLNAILGWTVTLRGRSPGPDLDRALAIIERNARAQARLVEDVLDVSRIISGKLSLVLETVKLGEPVAGAVAALAPAAEAKAVTVRIENDDPSITVTADADRMQQVVWNLVSNAVKFTPGGGSVLVRIHRDATDACVAVTDTGEGIGAEMLPYVFEPFRQADASTTRRHGGLGLGLAIVRHIVTAHGGTVSASSEGRGRGATFTVRIPVRAFAALANDDRAALRAGGQAVHALVEGAAHEAPNLDGLKILLVDDEEDARVLLGDMLGARGAEVRATSSVGEALEVFAAMRPDVVVSDIAMPDADGYSLIRRIRSLAPEDGGRTPAVALTAHARREDAQRAFAAGFQMHVAKPVHPSLLVTLVAKLGGRSLG
jgi:PAS domain S-box-containing protein